MKQVVKSIIVAGAMLAAGSAVAMTDDVKPYIGLDYYQAWMRGTTGTANILPRSYPGATVYVGARFMEYWGIEVGADWSARKKRTTAQTVNGVAGNLTTRVRRKGVHADIVGFLPVNECFDLLGFIGFGWVKPQSDATFTPNGTTVGQSAGVNVKGRGVARLGVGASYMVTDMVGLRAKLGWENTRQLRFDGASSSATRPFKDTVAMSLGAFVRW